MICESSKTRRAPCVLHMLEGCSLSMNLGPAGGRLASQRDRVFEVRLACRYVKGSPEKGELGDCKALPFPFLTSVNL